MRRLAYLCTDPGIVYGTTKGAAVHIREIVAALAEEGAEVLVLVQAQAVGAEPPRGVTLETLPGPGRGATAAERVAIEPLRARWIGGRLRRFGAEALMERVALHSAAGGTAARALGIPHLVELNAPLLEEAASYRILELPAAAERLERATLAGASLVLAVSDPLAAYATRRGARRVEVMPNGVALERFPVRLAHSDEEPPRAVFCGSLRPWHGAEVIARAWELLGPAAPPLLVVGDGPGRGVLEGVGAEITGALGPERVPMELGRAEIGLAPYAADAPSYFSPLKLFEYLAAGLAVVAADLPGVASVVDSRSAVLVKPGDPLGLALAVGRLAAHPGDRRRLAQAGRRLVGTHTWRDRARRILTVADELVEADVERRVWAGASS
jgi:glycosyltransferase involved in cell wall biosynthesis